jgi:hypothetical protein
MTIQVTLYSTESIESGQMFGFGRLYKFPPGGVNESSRYDTPVRRRNSLRKKVDKLTASTKSLFNRSKAKKEEKVSRYHSVV